MLTSLGIKNYRNLKSLEVEKLARVNLIAGKNNTGKTSLLEAVALYVSGGSIECIDNLLRKRGEFFSELEDNLKNNLQSYISLFNGKGREIDPSREYELSIKGARSPNELGRALKITIEFQKEDLPILLKIDFDHDVQPYEYDMAKINRDSRSLVFDQMRRLPSRYEFVRTIHTEEELARVWDYVALRPEEKHLVDALKLIDDNIESISFVKDESSLDKRKAVVGIGHDRLPLKSMGEGMNRILTIMLALVSIQKRSEGYLLIDEFENGLHYTVQEDLWKMIFQLAKELNVQVFATTHSNDCIRAFENVLNDGNHNEGQFLRLEKFGDIIKPIFYSSSDLEAAVDQHIETR